MPKLTGHRLAVDLPGGWDGRIFRRDLDRFSAERGGQSGAALQVASFGLPAVVADFGNGAVERMAPSDVLVMLVEYGPESVGTPLFAASGPPTLGPGDFSPATLLRALPNQAGSQTFFSANGRAFCLYVVIGDAGQRSQLAPRARSVVGSIEIAG
ncbi:MAG: hypothetical protein ABR511_09820 [Acidimicrobiales bacterium]